MNSDEAVRDLYERNEAAREWTADKVAGKLGLTEDQVRQTAEFQRNLARKDEQKLLADDYVILEFAAAAPGKVRASEIGRRSGKPRPAIRKQLDALVDDGYLARTGGNRGGYAITDEGRRALTARRG